MKVASLRSAQGGWTLLQLDNVIPMVEQWGWQPAQIKTELPGLIRQIVALCSPLTSGLILDPDLGLPFVTHKAKKVGLALRLESMHASDPLAPPLLDGSWGIEEIRANYAVAKLGLAYHPSEGQALAKKQFLAEIADYCQYVGVELLIDWQWLSGTGDEASAAQGADAFLWAAQELAEYAQVLVVPPPPDPLTAASLTAELDTPWLIGLRQGEYPAAKDQLRQALEAGAQGASLGQVVWTGVPAAATAEEVGAFLQGEARDRLIEMKRIIDESAASA